MKMKKLKREQQLERKGSKELRISDGNKEVWKERRKKIKDEGKTGEKMMEKEEEKETNKLKL